jgi:magnesium-transporting ATPase (P-type)
MATGDNGRTACSVARKWGIISSKAYFKIDVEKIKDSEIELKLLLIDYIESSRGTIVDIPEEEDDQAENNTDDEGEIEDLENRPLLSERSKEITSLGAASQQNINNDRVMEATLDEFMGSNIKIDVSISGKAFEFISKKSKHNLSIKGYKASEIMKKILKSGKVYSRMSPLQKASLVKHLQSNGKLLFS